MLAAIDLESGVVYTDAHDEAAHDYPNHPDTGFQFNGFHITEWDEIVASVKEWATYFPGIRVIGWDVAVSANKGVQLVEGNAWGMVNVFQVATRTGFYREFLKKIDWEHNK